MESDQAEEQEWQGVLARAETLRRLSPRPTAAEIADARAELSVSRATNPDSAKTSLGKSASIALSGEVEPGVGSHLGVRTRLQENH
jgi:hypothetical protein